MTTTQTPADQSPPLTLRGLLEAGAHFGHPTKRWHPKMKPYIFTARNKIHVFDLAKTLGKLEIAANFIEKTAGEGGQVMLVGTKKTGARSNLRRRQADTLAVRQSTLARRHAD